MIGFRARGSFAAKLVHWVGEAEEHEYARNYVEIETPEGSR
jgi:hypothetical protein